MTNLFQPTERKGTIVPDSPSQPDDDYPFKRFLTDLKTRYSALPAPPTTADGEAPGESGPPHDGELEKRVSKLPAEIGALLVVIGVAGLLLPGPVGSPFVLAGGLVLWPKGFGRVEDWFAARFPGLHREGEAQINRFLLDLERRYPGSTN